MRKPQFGMNKGGNGSKVLKYRYSQDIHRGIITAFLSTGSRSYKKLPDLKGPGTKTTGQNWEREDFP